MVVLLLPFAGNRNTQIVHQTAPGRYTYIVKVNDPRWWHAAMLHDRRSYVRLHFKLLDFNVATLPPIPCSATNGSIQVTITQPATGGPFTSIFNNGAPVTNQTSPITFNNLGGGAYPFSIQDESSGCVTSGSATISGSTFGLTPMTENNVCDERAVQALTNLPAAIAYPLHDREHDGSIND